MMMKMMMAEDFVVELVFDDDDDDDYDYVVVVVVVVGEWSWRKRYWHCWLVTSSELVMFQLPRTFLYTREYHDDPLEEMR